MDLETTYKMIKELDDEEKIGYEYYKQTGEYLRYEFLMFLKTQEDPYDFSKLTTQKAKEFKKNLVSKFTNKLDGVLNEQLFIENNVNVEIQHLPRFIDIFAHRHDFFELVCVMKDSCLHKVEGTEAYMHKGDVTIISPNVRHYLKAEPDSDCTVFTIKIRKSTFDNVFSVLMRSGTTLSAFFSKTLYSVNYRNTLTFHCGDDAFLAELLLWMYTQQLEHKRHHNYIIEGLLSTFFPYLVQNYEKTIEIPQGENPLSESMIEIENYIRQNYKTATLESTASHFNFSPSYLSRKIKNQTGFTFSYILRQLRMQHAADLLTKTTLNLEQICEKIGYCDTTQFIKSFKQHFGTTPNKYRKSKT